MERFFITFIIVGSVELLLWQILKRSSRLRRHFRRVAREVETSNLPWDDPEKMKLEVSKGKCPYCGTKDEWLEGPSGGMSQNMQCDHCGARYNIAIFSGSVMFIELIRMPTAEAK